MAEKKNIKEKESKGLSRRDFLKKGAGAALALGMAGVGGASLFRSLAGNTFWQLDPDKCIQCGSCAVNCVLSPSAVRCVHAFAVCGYCDLCSAYLKPNALELNTAAENKQCPTSAIKRTFIEDPYYEYVIDRSLCIGCGKCVKGCQSFGNGSLFLQVMHDICAHCNECSIAKHCPAKAYRRVPSSNPYLLKGPKGSSNA